VSALVFIQFIKNPFFKTSYFERTERFDSDSRPNLGSSGNRPDEEGDIRWRVKNLTVSNAEGRYALACNSDLDSCLTLAPGKDYLLFTKTTKWKFPGATGYVTLEWLQRWSVTYNNQENVALVPAEGDRSDIGMYWLVSWNKDK